MFLKQVFNHILEKWPLHGKGYVSAKFSVLVQILAQKPFSLFTPQKYVLFLALSKLHF